MTRGTDRPRKRLPRPRGLRLPKLRRPGARLRLRPRRPDLRGTVGRIVAQEDINFLLTNRLPRRLATKFMGWFSKIEAPLIARPSLAMWRFFSDVDLTDAETVRFRSLHHGFVRTLRPGARPVDPRADTIASPCDAIVGACGRIDGDRVYQIKGFPYRLRDLMGEAADDAAFHDGSFVTLRLTAGMYHRFHAPDALTIEAVTYISGDTWNVNPVALKRIERLFCRNERALIRARLTDGTPLMLVPVAAILVASIRLTFLDTRRALRVGGPRTIACSADFAKGDELGWFEHGSTILMFVPPGIMLHEDVVEGRVIRAGQALMRRAGDAGPSDPS